MAENKYCAYPFNEIYSDNASKYRLCCFATNNKSIEKYNAINTLPFDYFMSDEMEQIRQDMMEGKRVQGCEYCYKLEDAGKLSPRTEKYNKYYKQKSTVDKIDLKLRIGGSHCNLGCYMCIPYNSSFRRQELKESGIDKLWKNKEEPVPGIGYSFDDSPKNLGTKRFDEIVDNIIQNIDKVNSIRFIGGEPVIISRMWEIMDRIPDENAKDITIRFQSNLTKLHYKNYSVFDITNKFKSLFIDVSSDHYQKKLSWIRYPIDVEEFERNLKEAHHIISGIDCTVSILNVNDLTEIYNYYKDNFNLTVNFETVVTNPSMLSCKNIKNKQELLDKYSNVMYDMVKGELSKEYNEEEYQQAMNYCLSLSKHRKIDFRSIFNVA